MGSAVVKEPKTTETSDPGSSADHVAVGQPDVGSGESLTGIRLVSCLAALLICNFVVSLDMVSLSLDGQATDVG